jgi:hypothetical protein
MSDIRDQNRDPAAQRPQAPHGPGAGAQDRSIVVREPPRSATDSLVLGELVRHGRAPYTFQPNGEPSYFVTLKTERGERTLWSRGLERALAESRTQPQAGESVGVRENGINPVTVITRQRNARGEVVSVNRVDTPRGHWIIERRDWFDERAIAAEALRDAGISRREAIRNHPELLGAYWALDSASKVAEARIKNPVSRERFVALVRESLAHAIERGEPIPQPRKRGEPAAGRPTEPTGAPTRQEPERAR